MANIQSRAKLRAPQVEERLQALLHERKTARREQTFALRARKATSTKLANTGASRP